MKTTRIGIAGLGNMGMAHVDTVLGIPSLALVAVCDVDEARVEKAAASGVGIVGHTDFQGMLDTADLDALIIATPHFDHRPMAEAAFARGLHVLVEKPLAVHGRDARAIILAHETASRKDGRPPVFAVMFQQRTYGHWRKIKSLIDEGELGRLVRLTWIITDWFRTAAYYASGGWRATWAGEGGGVLLNQSPHQLDLLQWFVGVPSRAWGFAGFGKYHDIEVEDEVTAYFEYDSGLVAHFISSTAESPGTNRLEIIGENGKLIFENGRLEFHRNRRSMLVFMDEAPGPFDKVECWPTSPPYTHHGEPGHRQLIENFAVAVDSGAGLVAPGAEGLGSVLMANAVIYSAKQGNRRVDLSLDDEAYVEFLSELQARSKPKAPTRAPTGPVDLSKSFT